MLSVQIGAEDSKQRETAQLIAETWNQRKFVSNRRKSITLWNVLGIIFFLILIISVFVMFNKLLKFDIAKSLLISLNSAGIIIAIFYTIDGYNSFEKNQNLSCCKKLLKVIPMAFSKRGIYASLFTAITTASSNYALITDFYLKSYGNQSDQIDIDNGVNYYVLFWLSLFILLFHRLISSFIIYSFSLKISDFILQLFDFKIFDVVYISWKYDYKQSTTLQNYISLMRSIFESTPKVLITIHLLIINDTNNIIYWISAIFNIITIAQGNISEDTNYFKEYNNSRDLDWDTANGFKCSCIRCGYINFRYIIRCIWRYNDVIIHVLLISYSWYFISGYFIIYNIFFEFILLLFISILNKFGLCCHSKELCCKFACTAPIEWNMFTGLIATFPNSTDMENESVYRITSAAGIFCSWYRHIWNVVISIYGIFIIKWFNLNNYNIYFQYFLLFQVILNIYLYVVVCGRYTYCICTCKCAMSEWEWKSYLGDNWTVLNYYNTRSLAGCSTLSDLRTLIEFGYKLRNKAAYQGNWYWMKEPWKIVKYIRKNYENVELKNISFYGTGPLHLLSQNRHITNESDITEAYNYFINELGYNVNQKEKQWGWTPLMQAAIGKYNNDASYHKVKVLLDNNADLTIKNDSGYTVFDYNMRDDIRKLLYDHINN